MKVIKLIYINSFIVTILIIILYAILYYLKINLNGFQSVSIGICLGAITSIINLTYKHIPIFPFLFWYKYKKSKTISEKVDLIEKYLYKRKIFHKLKKKYWYKIIKLNIEEKNIDFAVYEVFSKEIPFKALIKFYSHDEEFINEIIKILDYFSTNIPNSFPNGNDFTFISFIPNLTKNFLNKYKNYLTLSILFENYNFDSLEKLEIFKKELVLSTDKYLKDNYLDCLKSNKLLKKKLLYQFISMNQLIK